MLSSGMRTRSARYRSSIANLISTRRLHTLNLSRSSHSNSSTLPTLIAALPSLTSLGIPGCPRIAAAILAEGSNALHRQLTSLDVSHCNLPAQSLTSVPLQRLRSLSCAGNPALRGLPALIFTLPAIESFDMDGCTFDPEYDDPVTEPHVATSTFTLPRSSPTSADIPDLSPCGPARDAESDAGDAVEREPISMRKASATRSSALSSLLSKLTMASCTGVTDDAVGELVARLPGVTYLDVSYNTALTSASLHSIARHCPRIRHLFASGCERMHTRDAIAVVATLSPSLRSASLGSLPLRAGTWPVLSKVVLCRQRDVSRLDGFGSSAPLLSHVNLANNATLRDAHLASLRLPNLVSLTVSACVGVRGTGIAALLSRSTVLTTLRMSLCAISSDALHEILEACGATLTSLDIGLCTSVDVRGVRGIASRAPRIQQMVLGNRRALSGLTGQDVLHVMDALADLHTLDLYQVDARIVVACGQRGTIRPCITAHEVDRDGISSDLIKHVAVAVSTNPNHPDTIDLALR
ncbi:unnamed protein product (mitochondrion) [Plasmodiophora brassicae]|uniref:F-box domain-containing protein n=2 Tax=Plasmodiophora brassicae TaxID=37360 RepID=A0A3P3YDJ9_PLABS|nr:unnamed protein product [Plasmodiophora brassicae]